MPFPPRFVFLIFLLVGACGCADQSVPDTCRQKITVNTSYNSNALLQRYERKKNGQWQALGETIAVKVGRSNIKKGKREGDGATPAGIFRLSAIISYAPLSGLKMPNRIATPSLICVDDPASRYYNTIIDQDRAEKDYRSFEKMRRDDNLYEILAIIDYNTKRIPGHGSCIFMHIRTDKPTAGCVAMTKVQLLPIIRWLDAGKNPYIVIEP